MFFDWLGFEFTKAKIWWDSLMEFASFLVELVGKNDLLFFGQFWAELANCGPLEAV